ncbi:WD domain repeat-containing protein 55, partial [Sarracenia purpurea var. burkii]
MGSCRRIEFDDEGESIYSISDDKCIVVADADSGKFKSVFDIAHRRKRDQEFSVKVGTDYVSSLKCLDEASTMACTAGDGIVS